MKNDKLYIENVINRLEKKVKEQRKIVFETQKEEEKVLLLKYQKLLVSKYQELEKIILNEIN